MDCSTPALPVHHQLPEFTQTRCVGDPIQPSHPLSSDIQDSKCYVKTFLSIVIIPQNFKVLLKVLQLLKPMSNQWCNMRRAAKSLQSCPTLCDPRRQPTRLTHPWDSPGKNTGVGCHFLLQCMKMKSEVKSLNRVGLLATPWTAAYQAPPSMDFPGKSTGVGCYCLLHMRREETSSTT